MKSNVLYVVFVYTCMWRSLERLLSTLVLRQGISLIQLDWLTS